MTRRRIRCRRRRPRSTMSRVLHGLQTAPRCCVCSAARRAGRRASSTGWRPSEHGAAVERSRHLLRASLARSASPIPRRLRAMSPTGARARPRSLRSPAAQQAFEAMLPRCSRRSPPAPIRITRSTASSDIVERLSSGRQFLSPARGAARACRGCSRRSWPMLRRWPTSWRGGRSCSRDCSTHRASRCRRDVRRARAEPSPRAMRGQPYDVALDRVRRLVSERRFALGVQLIDRRRDPLDVAAGYARVAEGAIVALAGGRGAEFAAAHGGFDDGELVVLGLGRLGGRALTHASDLDIIYLLHAPRRRRVGRRQAARRQRLLQPPGEPGHGRAERADRGRAALRRRHSAAAAGREGHARGLARRVRALSARTKPGRGSIWRCAGRGRCTGRPRRASGSRRDHREHPAPPRDPAAVAPTRRRCAPKWRATSRRRARSTSSSGRAGWSTSSSRSTCCS